MRNIFLIIMIVFNIIVMSVTFATHIQIENLSLRVFLVAFSIVISVYLILLRKTKSGLYLSILLLLIGLFHAYTIANAVYHYIY